MQTQTLEDARHLVAALTDPDGLPESPGLICNDDQREGTSYLRLSISYDKGDDGYRPKPRGYYLHVMRHTYDGDNIRYVRTRIGDPANFWLFASPATTYRHDVGAHTAALMKALREYAEKEGYYLATVEDLRSVWII